MKHYYLTGLVCFFLSKAMVADSIPVEASLQYFAKPENKQVQTWIRTRTDFSLNRCKFTEIQQFRTVFYYQLECGEKIISNILRYGQKSPEPMSERFRILAVTKIGNKLYLEIRFLVLPHPNWENTGNRSNSNSTPSELALKPKKASSYNQPNPNLWAFRDIAHNAISNYRPSQSMDIYFDHSCPLLYLGSVHDFYWDNRIYHDFEISCTKNSQVGILRAPSHIDGSLILGDQLVSHLTLGKRYLSHIKLVRWTDNRMEWDNARFYDYE